MVICMFIFIMLLLPLVSTLFPYTTLFRSRVVGRDVILQEPRAAGRADVFRHDRSEEHTSELQSQFHLVCRLLLEKKKSSWKRFCLFVCRALSSIMVICMLTAIRLLLTFVMSLYLLLRS